MTKAGAESMPPPLRAALLLFFLALGWTMYKGGLNNDFVWDDRRLILENPGLQDIGKLAGSIFSTKYFDLSDERYYRPIVSLSYAINLKMFGRNPAGFHATNLAVHLLVSALIWRILALLSKNEWAAWAAAAVFLCHPIHSEPVDFIAARVDLFSALFFFLALYFHLLAILGERGRAAWRVAAFMAYCLGLLSKEMAITMPAAAFVIDRILVPPAARPSGLKANAILYGPYAAAAGLYLYFRLFLAPSEIFHIPWQGGSIAVHMATMANVFYMYIRLLFAPVGRCTDYFSFPLVWEPGTWKTFAAAGGHAALVALAVGLAVARRARWAAAACLFFYIALLPVSNLVPILTFVSERFLYIPSFGLCLLILPAAEWVVGRMAPRRGRSGASAATAAALLLIVPIAGFSRPLLDREHEIWRSDLTLFKDQTVCSPASASGFIKLGIALAREGDLPVAAERFEEALRMDPDYSVWNNLGNVRAGMGQYDEAARAFREAWRMNPGDANAPFFLFALHRRIGREEEALGWLRKAVEAGPENAKIQSMRAKCGREKTPACDILRIRKTASP